jgi:hypothetical protein
MTGAEQFFRIYKIEKIGCEAEKKNNISKSVQSKKWRGTTTGEVFFILTPH